MAISKALQKLEDGSYFDRIVDFVRYGEKKALNGDDKLIFERIERIKDILIHYKDTSYVVRIIRNEPDFKELSTAQLYNYVNDAKVLYALFEKFNLHYELMLQKSWIDKTLRIAEEEKDARMMKAGLDENRKWILMMDEEQRRSQVKEERSYTFIFHMDFKQIGVTDEVMAEWTGELNEIKRLARQKYKEVIPVEPLPE